MVFAQTENQSFPFNLKVVLIILCCGLFYGCLIHPLRHELEETQQNISRLRFNLTQREAKEQQLAQSSAQLERRQEQLAGMLSALRKPPSSPTRALQDLASSNSVEIGWSSPTIERGTRLEDKTRPIPHKRVAVDLEGRFGSLRDYFESVCLLEWSLGIESCEIESLRNHDDTTNLRAKLVLKVPALESDFNETNTED